MTSSNQAQAEGSRFVILSSIDAGETINSKLVIMSETMPSGKQHVLARFGDIKWLLPSSICVAGVSDLSRTLNFNRLQNPLHIEPLKIAFSIYYLRGIPGGKPPSGSTLVKKFSSCVSFLNYLSKIGKPELVKLTPMICAQYASYCKALPGTKENSQIGPSALAERLNAPEKLYALLESTKYAIKHPWPDSSGKVLANYTQPMVGKTAIIPTDVAKLVMQTSASWLKKSIQLLPFIRNLVLFPRIDRHTQITHLDQSLREIGLFHGWDSLNEELRTIQSACMFIILMTTGMRIHELLSLQINSAYSVIDDDGIRQYWIKGVSKKTHEGETEWLCPKIAADAIQIAEKIGKPFRDLLRKNSDFEGTEVSRVKLQENSKTLFVDLNVSQIRPVTSLNANNRLKNYFRECGAEWAFSTHQCRRTFAVYVVRHALGDLRYLRDHYKHWSLDMTAIYAANQAQDQALYDEIYLAIVNEKSAKVKHWLDPDTPVAGGMGERIKVFRSKGDDIRTYATQAEMLKGVSDTISLRATGVAWCTADLGGCNGGSGPDRTKCGDCDGSIIDDKQLPIWEAIYTQQLELINLDDIGEQGRITAKRALKRCEKVLADLGADVALIKEKVLS